MCLGVPCYIKTSYYTDVKRLSWLPSCAVARLAARLSAGWKTQSSDKYRPGTGCPSVRSPTTRGPTARAAVSNGPE